LVFKFLDAIWPKTLADKVKDIVRIKEMDPNEWTIKEVGDIAIRLEKAQGEESLWTTSVTLTPPVNTFLLDHRLFTLLRKPTWIACVKQAALNAR